MRILAFLCLLSSSWALPAIGQDSACTYERCALRLQYRGSGIRVVQGLDGTRIARLGFYPPHIDLLAAGDDSTRLHYDAFRKYNTRSAKLGIITIILSVTGGTLIGVSHKDAVRWTGVGLATVGLGFSFGATASGRRGQDELSQALWFYNRQFAP